jgi:DNA-binding beta-propeller fold protein YncE
VLTFARDPASGALTQIGDASGAARMRSPAGLAIAPDGTALYVSWTDPFSESVPDRTGLSVLRRDPGTGALSEVVGETGCLDSEGLDGCTAWRAISTSSSVITPSPDGRHLYVGAEGLDGSIVPRMAMLQVDPATGGLRPPDPAGCPGTQGDREPSSPCARIAGVWTVAVTPDGRHLYTGNQAFRRDPATGLLTRVAGRRGCYFVPDLSDPEPELGRCMSLRQLYGAPEAVTSTPDGRHVYMGDEGRAVGGFTRERATGRLQPIGRLGGCARLGAGGGCSLARGLKAASDLAVAPDGRTLYLISYESEAIVVLNRDRRTGALWQLAGRNGCLAWGNRRQNDTRACAAAHGLGHPWELVISPDGRNLYALSDAGIAVFAQAGGAP